MTALKKKRRRATVGTAHPPPARLKDVALAAGVSVATASMVLNQPHAADQIGAACSTRVWQAATRLGYVPNHHAQAMRGLSTRTIGVAIEFGPSGLRNELAQGYFSTLIGGVDETLRQARHSMMIINGMGGLTAPEAGVQALRRRQIDGLILIGVTHEIARNPVFVAPPPGLPIVAIEYGGRTDLPVIGFDERGGIEMAVAHLRGLGHRSLLWLGPEAKDRSGAMHSRERLFRQVARKRGFRVEVCRQGALDDHLDSEEGTVDAGGIALRTYLLQAPSPGFTAIVCYNDLMAMGAYGVLAERGLRVPADISVIGFDNIQARLLIPKLTSVSHVLPEMGARAVSLLLEMVASPAAVARYRGFRDVIPTRLIVRTSTAPARVAPGR